MPGESLLADYELPGDHSVRETGSYEPRDLDFPGREDFITVLRAKSRLLSSASSKVYRPRFIAIPKAVSEAMTLVTCTHRIVRLG